jgi:drug/metabolite transporter (DMT)-like permease
MIGIVLALLSAAASAISVVSVRRHSGGSSVFNMSMVITAVGLLALLPLTIAEGRFDLMSLSGFALFAVSGLFSPGLVRLFYYKGMKNLGASVNSSVFAVYPLYTSVLAVVLLNEIVTAWNVIGIIAIVTGVILVERNMNGNNGTIQTGWKSMVAPVLGGLMLGGATIFRKLALEESNVPVFGVAVAYIFSLLPYIIALAVFTPVRKDLTLKQDFRWFWAAGIGQAVSWLLAFYALSFEQVSITTPLLSIEPLFVVALGFFYLRELESISSKLVVSIAITVLGVVFVVL